MHEYCQFCGWEIDTVNESQAAVCPRCGEALGEIGALRMSPEDLLDPDYGHPAVNSPIANVPPADAPTSRARPSSSH